MSTAEVAARALKEIEPEDIQVLLAIEKSIPLFESVPLGRVQRVSSLHHDRVLFRLGRLNRLGFVMKKRTGYILLTAGLDILALDYFVKKGLIAGMGKSIGIGKESDVFQVVNDAGERSVVKFYRIGRTSFRTPRKSRSYVDPQFQHQWLTINMHAAIKEEVGLEKAKEASVNSPRFISRSRHAVLMSEIDGVMLYSVSREQIGRPSALLEQILLSVRRAYLGADLINGDLSEYNILFDGESPWIIDWPQFVSSSHVNATEILKRDLQNVLNYFTKKFDVRMNLEKTLSYVTGKTSSITG